MPASKPRHRSLLFGLALLYQAPAGAQLPSGGNVVGGSATIGAPSGNQQVITQTSQKAIIDWQDFSIGAGNSVRFNQPNASSIMLNRVIGNNPSNIAGSLSANGQLFLVNPFGVYFGAGSSVDVAGLMATTLNIRNDDFMAGRYSFRRDSLSAARREVVNAGVLKAREGGYVVLAGDYAANQGVIQAKLGTAALASGDQMTLDIVGDSLINFAVNEKTVAELSGVENSGQLLADGGRAIMTAAVARDLATAAVNNSGLVQAQTAEEREGAIYLSAGDSNALVSGKLDASGKAAGQKGGAINVLGDKVALVGSAVLDASGAAGGGTINVGGSFQGKGPLPNASTAYVGKDVSIKADALDNGNGGEVVVWSDDYTRFYGNASLQGGAQGGDGGRIEVSGKAILDYNGSINTLAAKGKAGTLLLDPSDIEILAHIDPATADMTGTSPFSDATNNGGISRMGVGALEGALAGGHVTITTNSAGSSAGNITIDDGAGGGLQWGSGSMLRLQAANRIYLKSHVQGANGTLWLDAGNGAEQTAGTNITAKSLLLTGGGNWDLAGIGNTGSINSFNNVNTFAANITGGRLEFSNAQNLNIGSVNGINGVTHTFGNTLFYLDRNNAALRLTQDINSSNLYLRASGGVSQTGGGITANRLALSGGAASLTQSGNKVGTLAADINGALNFTNSGALTIGSTWGVSGIRTNNHNVTLRTGNSLGFNPENQPDATNPASLVLNQSINAGWGMISLTAGMGGVYQRSALLSDGKPDPAGSLTATGLALRSDGSTNGMPNVAPFVLSNAHNRIGILATSVNGSVSYTGGPLTVGTVDGIIGITTTSGTIVKPAGVDKDGRPTPDIYNDNNVSLSIGGDLLIKQNINAKTSTGSGSVSIGVGGDFVARSETDKRIDANTVGVFGDDMKGQFFLKTNTSSLAAAGGKLMVIDNSTFTDELTALGIGAPAANASATKDGKTVVVDTASKPVGDFYLTTGGSLNIIKLLSKGKNLMLRANSLDIVVDAATANGARIMLQPYDLTRRIGIHNSSDSDFSADTNYSAEMLTKFTNPTATFYIGTPQNSIFQAPEVPPSAKNIFTGDIHIGSDGAFDLGYRSLSAGTTSGSIVAHNIGRLYNLRLKAPNLTIHNFNTFGDQIHLITNNLRLPGNTTDYVNPNKPNIMLRTMNDHTVWIGSPYLWYEPNILSSTLVKLPDYSTIIISGSTDHPFPNGGEGYGDIHIPWNDSTGVSLGHRNLVLSTGHKIYTYSRTPAYTRNDNGGTSGGLWQGCTSLASCMKTNPPNPNDPPIDIKPWTGGEDTDTEDPQPIDPPKCANCPPAPPNVDPFPPQEPPKVDPTPPPEPPKVDPQEPVDPQKPGDTDTDVVDTDPVVVDPKPGDGDGEGDGGGESDTDFTDPDDTDSTDTDVTDTDPAVVDPKPGDGDGDGDGGGAIDTEPSDPDDTDGGDQDGIDTNTDVADPEPGDGDGDGDGNGDGGGAADTDPSDLDNTDGGDQDGIDTNTDVADKDPKDNNGDGDGGGAADGGKDDGNTGDGDGGDGTDTDPGGDGTDGAGDGDDGAGTDGGGSGDGDGSHDDEAGTDADGDGSNDTHDGNDARGDDGAGSDSGGDGDDGSDQGKGTDGSSDNGNGDGSNDGTAGGDGGNATDGGGTQDGDGGADAGDAGNGSGVHDDDGTDDGAGDDGGDAGSATASGGTGENGENGNDAGGNTDDGPDGSNAPTVDLDCQDVEPDRLQKKDTASQRANRELIEVKQDGVKLRDPCQQKPAQKKRQ